MIVMKGSPRNIQEALEFSVIDLVKTVLYVCAPDAKMPEKLPSPPALQAWLDSLNVVNYKTAGPQIIARKKGSDVRMY